jgi:hypothetical protein
METLAIMVDAATQNVRDGNYNLALARLERVQRCMKDHLAKSSRLTDQDNWGPVKATRG